LVKRSTSSPFWRPRPCAAFIPAACEAPLFASGPSDAARETGRPCVFGDGPLPKTRTGGLRSERGAPLSAPGFSRMIKRAASAADLGINAHAHMLRLACGYKLANDGHDTRASRRISGIATFRTRRAIPRLLRIGSRNFLEIDRHKQQARWAAPRRCPTTCQPAAAKDNHSLSAMDRGRAQARGRRSQEITECENIP